MAEDVTKRLCVTFSTGLPMGTHGRFKHDGKMWVAYPAGKYGQIMTVIDRLVGIHNRIATDMTRWINEWPEDAPKAARILEHVHRANQIHTEIVGEKTEAATS